MAKKSSKPVEKISAEGLVVALEYISERVLTDRSKQGKSEPEIGMVMQDGNGRVKVKNTAAIVFALTHPWVELHTNAGACGNDEKAHLEEYKHMLQLAHKLLDERAELKEQIDNIDEEDEDDLDD
jgi:hypothetical protein